MSLERVQLTVSIVKKWKEQGLFIRFLNGNTLDCNISNLRQVQIEEAMEHIDDWVVDWDLHLTDDEVQFVMDNPEWREKFIALKKHKQ